MKVRVNQPYWSYLDAYQYLERALNLGFTGALTDDPHITDCCPRLNISWTIGRKAQMCLLAETSTSSSQYRKVGEWTVARG